MKSLLKKLLLICLIITLSSVTLFGCEFSLYPKDYVEIVADNNKYNSPYNTVSLVENIQKKMSIVQAFEISGTFSDGSTIQYKMISRDSIKNSSFSLTFNKKDDYTLKLNLRNKILYFKVPFKSMGIDSELNLGIKESVDDLVPYLPLFVKGLKIKELEKLTKEDYSNIFNQIGYTQYCIDSLLHSGETVFSIENYGYKISIKNEANTEININRDFSIKEIKSEHYTLNFSYPKVGEYVLEYPGEIVGIGYVTVESIEDSLGESFEKLLK